MIKLLLSVGIFIFMISCNQNKNSKSHFEQRLNEVNTDYLKRLDVIKLSNEITNHFPQGIDNLPIKIYNNFGVGRSDLHNFFYLTTFPVTDDKVDSIEKSIQKDKVVEIKKADDPSLNVFNQEKTCGSYLPFFESNSEFDNKEDVVKKEDIYSRITKSGLTEGFSVYIIKSGELNNKEIQMAIENNLGNFRCFSRGVAINRDKKTVIYWIIVW